MENQAHTWIWAHTSRVKIPDVNWFMHSCPPHYMSSYLKLVFTYCSISYFSNHSFCFYWQKHHTQQTHSCWWYPLLLYAHHAVTRQPASAAQHCGIPLGSVLRMSTLRRLWGSVYKERYLFKTQTNLFFSHNIPPDGSWCLSALSCVWFMMSVWHSLWERMVFLSD